VLEIAADASQTGIRHDAQLPPNRRVETGRQSACGTSFASKQVPQHLPRDKINQIEGFMRTARRVVDKYSAAASRWFALAARMLLPAGLFAMSVLGAVPHTAHAQTIDPATKLAPDLVSVLNAPTPGNIKWLALSEGLVLSEGIVLSEGLVLSETDVQAYSATGDGIVFGE
jgi:hypothetical protein